MNYFHILTLIFVVAKLFDKIDWSWWLVVTPSLISFAILAVVLGFAGFVIAKDK